MKMTKQEKSWVLYDWANSVYATIMMAAVAPIYFAALAKDSGQDGANWWGFGTSAAMIVIAFLAPVIGAMSDYYGYKKKLFSFFLVMGIGFTALTAVTGSWIVFLLGYILSHIGYSGSLLVSSRMV